MSSFIAGQKVVLVRDFDPVKREEAPLDNIVLPKMGVVYTVRDMVTEPGFGDFLLLEEVVNKKRVYLDVLKIMEQGFNPTRFQLADFAPAEAPASISILPSIQLA